MGKTQVSELNAAERRLQIARIIRERGSVRVTDLAKIFMVNESSIRRDLIILEQEGVSKRVHGGAIVISGFSRAESFLEKMRQNIATKRRIGIAASELIKSGDILLFDSGTTTLQIVRNIPVSLRVGNLLSMATNSISIATEVLAWPSPNLNLLGGVFMPDYQATVGPETIAQLSRITVDKVFLGTDGLTLKDGFTTAHILMAEVDRVMAERARQVILVTDSSKLGRAGFIPIKPITSVNLLITDTNAPEEIVSDIRRQGVEVQLVSVDSNFRQTTSAR